MTYDFFNTSHLAFGPKITSAFNSLGQLEAAATANLDILFKRLEYYTDISGKNYRVPQPSKETDPCRTAELFDLLDDKVMLIKEMSYKENLFTFRANYFLPTNKKITVMVGTQEMVAGDEYFVYCELATTNTATGKVCEFRKTTDNATGTLLFKVEINPDGIPVMSELNPNIMIKPTDYFNHYEAIVNKETVGDGTYTATGYECWAFVGNINAGEVRVNGATIMRYRADSDIQYNHTIVYLKPDDVVTGNITRGVRLYYKPRTDRVGGV